MSGWICANCDHEVFWATLTPPEGEMYGRCRKDLDVEDPVECDCEYPTDQS